MSSDNEEEQGCSLEKPGIRRYPADWRPEEPPGLAPGPDEYEAAHIAVMCG